MAAATGEGPHRGWGGAEPLPAGRRVRREPKRAGAPRSRGGAPTAWPAGRGGTPRYDQKTASGT